MPDIADDPCLPIASQLEQATSVAQVRDAALQIDAVVTLQHSRAAPVEQIARQVCELNARAFARLWALLAPNW
jgi:CBS domain-containing protein